MRAAAAADQARLQQKQQRVDRDQREAEETARQMAVAAEINNDRAAGNHYRQHLQRIHFDALRRGTAKRASPKRKIVNCVCLRQVQRASKHN